MDIQFSSQLQKQLQDFGRNGKFAPPTSQDTADAILHEYFVAETGRSLFDKRKGYAKDKLKEVVGSAKIDKIVEDARKGTTGSFELIETENYSLSLAVKAPVKSIDLPQLTTELIRLGVDQTTIQKAMKAAEKFAKPAETYTVSVKTQK